MLHLKMFLLLLLFLVGMFYGAYVCISAIHGWKWYHDILPSILAISIGNALAYFILNI